MFLFSCDLTWLDFEKIHSSTCAKLRNDYFHDNTSKTTCPPNYDDFFCWPETSSLQNASLVCPLNSRRNDGSLVFIDRFCTRKPAIDNNLTVSRWSLRPEYNDCSIPTSRIGNILYEYSSIDPNYEFHPSQRIDRWKDYEWLYIMEQCMYLLSMFSLIVALLIFWKYSRLRNTVVKMHINLFVAMLLQFLISFIHNWIYACKIFYGNVLYDDDYWDAVACKTLVTFKNYFELTKFTWLLVKGWFLYKSISRAFYQESTSLTKNLVIGWGLPLIPVIAWITNKIYSSRNFCWVDFQIKFDILSITILCIVLINMCFFVLNLRIVFSKIKSTKSTYLHRKKYFFKWVKSSLMLVSFFGAYDIFYTLWPWIGNEHKKFYLLIIVQVINPAQGCLVAVLYCFINANVREEIQRSWKNCKSRWEINMKVLKQNFLRMMNVGRVKSTSTLTAPDYTAHF